MLTGNLNATRFAQKPLPQPSYRFADVPKAEIDLRGSSLQLVDNDRDAFHACMGEMLLLCKESLRRRRDLSRAVAKSTGSKPLSLEYLADRCDVDDPIFGFVVRTQENMHHRNRRWKAGMMQGFVTVTTFTNYQKTFRWDSLDEAAFSCDDDAMIEQRTNGLRAVDYDGTLSAEMQSTVRCGDIWNEGIVWPRIAEISLLGGLGCGGTLVSLVIEHLECMKASGKCNYEYVVLQATDNSISFYESMGFIRVGAVAKEENLSSTGSSDGAVAEEVDDSSPERANSIARPCEIVTSEVILYTAAKNGETPKDIAQKNDVDVWDVIFLNKDIYKEIAPSSRLKEGTVLHLPKIKKSDKVQIQTRVRRESPTWYVAKENETPRSISRKFNLCCMDFVEANKGRLPGLLSNSRLKDGTRVKISHLDVLEEDFKPYAHWTFPDDHFEEGEPSYMMARKLNRRRGNAARVRPFLESLAVPISEYKPTDLVIIPSSNLEDSSIPTALPTEHSEPNVSAPIAPKLVTQAEGPIPPKRPVCSWMIYLTHQRKSRPNEFGGMNVSEATKILSEEWQKASASVKSKYEEQASLLKEKYKKAKAQYEKDIKAYRAKNPLYEAPSLSKTTPKVSTYEPVPVSVLPLIKQSLYNKVVRIKPEGANFTEGSDYKYWYVLTFIPDLRWCHLGPMIEVGTFGDDKPIAKGRPKWMLLDESYGKEVDISSIFCIPIRSRSMKKTADADMEEWDIIDDGSDPTESDRRLSVESDSLSSFAEPKNDRVRKSTAMKPSTERKRKQTADSIPRLVAEYPRTKKEVHVRLIGNRLYDPKFDYRVPSKKRRLPKCPKKRRTTIKNVIKKDSGQPSEGERAKAIAIDKTRLSDASSLSSSSENVSCSLEQPLANNKVKDIDRSAEQRNSNSETRESARKRRTLEQFGFIKNATGETNTPKRSSQIVTRTSEQKKGIVSPVKLESARSVSSSKVLRPRQHKSYCEISPAVKTSKRKTSEGLVGALPPRKLRKVNSAGTRRSVLQN